MISFAEVQDSSISIARIVRLFLDKAKFSLKPLDKSKREPQAQLPRDCDPAYVVLVVLFLPTCLAHSSLSLTQNIHEEDKHKEQPIHNRMHFLTLLRRNHRNRIRNKSKRNPIRNTICQWHSNQNQERWNRNLHLFP